MFSRFGRASGLALAGTMIGLGTIVDVFGRGLNKLRAIDSTFFDNNNSDAFSSRGLPFDSPFTASDVRGMTQEQIAELVDRAMNSQAGSQLLANRDPRIGHYYLFISANRLTDPVAALALGSNVARVLLAQFPNVGKEIPPQAWNAISAQYKAQLLGTLPPLDLLAGVDMSQYRLERWKSKAPLDGTIVTLGSLNHIMVGQHLSFQHNDHLVTVLKNTVTSVHIFDGTAMWISIVNTKTGESRFVVVGAGEHPLTRGFDALNNVMVGVLWDVLGESFASFLKKAGRSLVEDDAAVNRFLSDPQFLRDALVDLPKDTQNHRGYLEEADRESWFLLGVRKIFSSLEAPVDPSPPPDAQQQLVEQMLDTIKPEDHLLDDTDVQSLEQDIEREDTAPADPSSTQDTGQETTDQGQTDTEGATDPSHDPLPERDPGHEETGLEGQAGLEGETGLDGQTGLEGEHGREGPTGTEPPHGITSIGHGE